MNRCQCLTQKGIQCSRDAKQGEMYCFQHPNCTNNVTSKTQKKITVQKKSQAKSQANPQAKSQAKPQAKSQANPQAKSQAKPKSKSQAKPQAKSQVKPKSKPQVKPKIQKELKPKFLLDDVITDMHTLGNNRTKPYQQCIQKIVEHHNDIDEENTLTPEKLNQIVYTGKQISVNIPVSMREADDEDGLKKITFNSDEGFTGGKLLYLIAQHIPRSSDEIEEMFGNHVYFEGLHADSLDKDTYELALGS